MIPQPTPLFALFDHPENGLEIYQVIAWKEVPGEDFLNPVIVEHDFLPGETQFTSAVAHVINWMDAYWREKNNEYPIQPWRISSDVLVLQERRLEIWAKQEALEAPA